MNIVHVLQTLDASGGGLPAAVKALAGEQSKCGHHVRLVSSDCGEATVNAMGCIVPVEPRVQPVGLFRSSSSRLSSRLRALMETRSVDVIHLHGVWSAAFPSIVRSARRLGIATVLSPHGQLMPALLESDSLPKKIKKRAFWAALGEPMLTRVSMLHAVGQGEARAIDQLSLGPAVVQIPNYVERRLFDLSLAQEPAAWDVDERVLLFLGRVERRKGVANLVSAFVESAIRERWRLEIVGPIDDKSLVASIEASASRFAEPHRLTLVGPIFGDQKLERLRRAHVVCLPSYSEVIGLVNVEAALMGRMVVTTPQAGVDQIANHGGVVCSNEPAVLRASLESLETIPADEYRRRCIELQNWARAEFAYERITGAWNTALSMLAGRGDAARTSACSTTEELP